MPDWYVYRLADGYQAGAYSLEAALGDCLLVLAIHGARRAAIFDGQPSDGARVVVRIDLDGLPDL